VLATCEAALGAFRELGCAVERANPDFSVDAMWRAWLVLRAWQAGAGLAEVARSAALRSQLKPEARFEIESGAKLSAYDVSAASAVRTQFGDAVRRFFERFDYWVLPTAQVFPFDVALDWPHEIAGRRMETYHEWMKVVLPVTMAGIPAAAVPAGFGPAGLPIGLQIAAPYRAERACLELAHAYDRVTRWVERRPPALLDA